MPRGIPNVKTEDQATAELSDKDILVKQANATWKPPADKERMVKLTVQKIGDDKASDFFLSVNFKDYLIKYGEEVTVPESVVHVLKNTSITTMVQDNHTEKMKPVMRPRFAFQTEAV